MLDQAIGVDWLVIRSGRADEALLGLWLSGYPVDAAAAQKSWIRQLKRLQHRRQRAASRYSGGFYGLGGSWWKKLLSTKTLDVSWWRDRMGSDRELADFLGDTEEWLHDEHERDDDAYRNQIAELIIRLTKADRKGVYRDIDRLWTEIDPASMLPTTSSIKLVESISLQELEAVQRSVAQVARILRHTLQLVSPTDRVQSVIVPLTLMRDLIGPVIAKLLVHTKRAIPEMPLEKTISSLHDFVMSVQSTDINKKNDHSVEFSEQVRIEWQATRKQLSQLWIAVREQSANQPVTLNGSRDPASG